MSDPRAMQDPGFGLTQDPRLGLRQDTLTIDGKALRVSYALGADRAYVAYTLRATIKGAWIVFLGSPIGTCSIDVRSSALRVKAHWDSYIEKAERYLFNT